MQTLTTFNFENNNVRSLVINNEPWFVGKDIADVLGYTNSRKALADHVYDEDKGVTICDTLGGRQKMTVINESGLYALIFGSKLESARTFKRWVTSEVLPQIRKTGGYNSNRDAERLELAKIISKTAPENLVYIKTLYPEYFNRAIDVNSLEYKVDTNTSYQNWIKDYRIDREYICTVPTLDLYNDYVSYCIERRQPHLGKITFYKALDFDFTLTRKQRKDGKRYFMEVCA